MSAEWIVNGFGGDFITIARLEPSGVLISSRVRPDDPIDTARKMAAAQELLEALRIVSNAYGCFAGCTAALAGPGECAQHTYSCSVARTALAKAEGK